MALVSTVCLIHTDPMRVVFCKVTHLIITHVVMHCATAALCRVHEWHGHGYGSVDPLRQSVIPLKTSSLSTRLAPLVEWMTSLVLLTQFCFQGLLALAWVCVPKKATCKSSAVTMPYQVKAGKITSLLFCC